MPLLWHSGTIINSYSEKIIHFSILENKCVPISVEKINPVLKFANYSSITIFGVVSKINLYHLFMTWWK